MKQICVNLFTYVREANSVKQYFKQGYTKRQYRKATGVEGSGKVFGVEACNDVRLSSGIILLFSYYYL